MRWTSSWAFHIAAALSGLLLVATTAVWTRTYHHNMWLTFGSNPDREIFVSDGSLGYRRNLHLNLPPSPTFQWARSLPWKEEYFLGFYCAKGETIEWSPARIGSGFHYYGRTFAVGLPLWLLDLPLSVLLQLWCIRWVRRWSAHRRERHGFCSVCGYDMRESPARCPECGTGRTFERAAAAQPR